MLNIPVETKEPQNAVIGIKLYSIHKSNLLNYNASYTQVFRLIRSLQTVFLTRRTVAQLPDTDLKEYSVILTTPFYDMNQKI